LEQWVMGNSDINLLLAVNFHIIQSILNFQCLISYSVLDNSLRSTNNNKV